MLKLTLLDRTAEVRAPSEAHAPGVYVWRDLAGRPCAYGHTVGGAHWMHWPRLASYRFDDDGPEVVAYPATEGVRDAIVETYHRIVLPIALQRRGLEALHASAVIISGRAAAFLAVSGTGKSTLAYALSRLEGHRQLSDDAVVFEVGPDSVDVLPLPYQVRLLPQAAAALSTRPVAAREPATDLSGRIPLGALCVLSRMGAREFGDLQVEPIEGPRALAAVLEHAHCFSLADPARKKRMLEHYLELVDRVPVHAIRFRPGLEKLPTIVEGVTRALSR